MNQSPITIDLVLEESNLPLVTTGEREQLVAVLKPLVEKIASYSKAAENPVVTNSAQAESTAAIIRQIVADESAVEESIIKHKSAAKKRHSLWCDLEGLFMDPFSTARRRLKQSVLTWQAKEAEKAEAERSRLQAMADEAARKERERLEKLAESRKTEEKKEMYREQAAAVVPAVIHVAAPTKAVSGQSRWFIKSVDASKFVEAAAKDKSLLGYITIEEGKLARAKAANDRIEIPGIVFEKRLV